MMQTVTIKRFFIASLLACTSLAVGLTRAQSSAPEFDPFYYNDEVYVAMSPGRHSANPNQLIWECFGLGPDLNGKKAIDSNPFYVILWSGGGHSCPDGGLEHDHVASEIPGSPGFLPHWRGVLVIPLDPTDPTVHPLTSEAAIETAEAAGQVIVIDTGIIFNAPVVRRSGL